MAKVKRTRLRRSLMRKMFRNFSSIGMGSLGADSARAFRREVTWRPVWVRDSYSTRNELSANRAKKSDRNENESKAGALGSGLTRYAAGAASEFESPIMMARPPAASMAFCAPLENL